VKDLSLLDRDINQTIIVDNSPMSYIFHPENAIDCTSFFDDPLDVELWQIADFLLSIKACPDVRNVCRYWRDWVSSNPSSVPTTIRATTTTDEAAMIYLFTNESSSNDISYTSSSSSSSNNIIGGLNNHTNTQHHDGVYSISSISSSSSSSYSISGSGGNHNYKHNYL
jgi:hypothetical protein